MYFFDERVYRGEWRNNLMHGYGEFYWTDGKRYIGYYEDDKKHGFGGFLFNIFPSLKAYVGYWENGVQEGLALSWQGNTIKYEKWRNGKLRNTFSTVQEMKRHAKKEGLRFTELFNENPNKIFSLLFEDYL